MRNTLVMIVLAVVAVATWLYGREPPPASDLDFGHEAFAPLGYYLRGARLLGTDEQGQIAYRILADRLEELPNQELLRLDGVRVEYRPIDAVPWLISAASANAPKDGSRLELAGAVELRSQPTDGSEPLAIATETLSFFPDSSSAESDAPVRISVGDWQLDAVGLRTHLKGDTVELESEVHGTFAP